MSLDNTRKERRDDKLLFGGFYLVAGLMYIAMSCVFIEMPIRMFVLLPACALAFYGIIYTFKALSEDIESD